MENKLEPAVEKRFDDEFIIPKELRGLKAEQLGAPSKMEIKLKQFLANEISIVRKEEREKVIKEINKDSDYFLNRFKKSRAGTNEIYLDYSNCLKDLAKKLLNTSQGKD